MFADTRETSGELQGTLGIFCLTKTMDSQVLRTCLKTGRYALQDEDHVLKNRSDHRQRLDWVKRQAVVEPPVESRVLPSSVMCKSSSVFA